MVTETHNVDFTAKDKTKSATASVSKNFDKVSSKADGLAGRFRNMARATAAVRGPLDGVAARMSSVGSLIGNVSLKWVAMGTAIAGASVVLKKSIGVFTEYEQSMLGINALIERTGGAAGVTGQQISDMAERIGRDTLASASEVRDAAAIMLTFKSVTGDAFTRSVELAQDMAAVMKQDLNSSVKQLGKVLEDPIRNLSALNRSGVSFTATQTAMIKKMVEMGDKAGAQTQIMDILAGQLGGYGAAEGAGVAGAIDLVGENWTLLMRKIGQTGIAKEAAEWMKQLANGMRNVAENIDPTLQEAYNQKLKELHALEDEGANARGRNAESLKNQHWLKKQQIHLELSLLTQQLNAEKEVNDAFEADAVMMAEVNAQNEAAAVKFLKSEEDKRKAIERTAKARQSAADKFGEQIKKEADQARHQGMEKLAVEDEVFANKMFKLEENHAAELLSDEEFFTQSELLEQAHQDRKTAIQKDADEQRLKNAEQVNSMIVNSSFALANDLTRLGQAAAGEDEALQRKLFIFSKAIAVAQIIVSTMVAAAKADALVPGSGTAVAALGYTRAAVVGATSVIEAGAREHGGPVIAGRPYKVGERGPEIFTPTQSGQIINNKTISNQGGTTFAPVYNLQVLDSEGVDRVLAEHSEKFYNTMQMNMFQNGQSFA